MTISFWQSIIKCVILAALIEFSRCFQSVFKVPMNAAGRKVLSKFVLMEKRLIANNRWQRNIQEMFWR